MPISTLALILLALAMMFTATRLAVMDLKWSRLPDKHVALLAAYVVGVVLLLWLHQGGISTPIRAFVGALVCSSFYALIRLLSNGGLGMGDVKIAAPLGGLTSTLGWQAFLIFFVTASLTGALTALVTLARSGPKKSIPYGPHLIFGAFVACLSSLSLHLTI